MIETQRSLHARVDFDSLEPLQKPEYYASDLSNNNDSSRLPDAVTNQSSNATKLQAIHAVTNQSSNATKLQAIQDALDCWTASSGKWIHDPARTPLYTSIQSNEENLGTRIYTACKDTPNNTDFAWAPTEQCPPVPQFSKHGMCEVMRGRLLLIIGDSLSVHHGETFLNAMGGRTAYTTPPILQRFEACTRPFSVLIIMAPNIQDHPSQYYSLIQEYAVEGAVIVGNWGIHYIDDAPFAASLRQHLDFFSSLNTTFIYRGANMAHLNCSQYTAPDNSLDSSNPQDAPDHPEWRWRDFPSQSARVARPLLLPERRQFFLDVLELNQRRPDRHPGGVDCLHYCLPGPIDEWVRLIYAALVFSGL
jgi:hypothetical protein